jgi:hypothetical protein
MNVSKIDLTFIARVSQSTIFNKKQKISKSLLFSGIIKHRDYRFPHFLENSFQGINRIDLLKSLFFHGNTKARSDYSATVFLNPMEKAFSEDIRRK